MHEGDGDERPLVSVIVPVYNVERQLDRCVNSIVGQDYDNLEIILVDDGSPDQCPVKCDAWAEQDSRITVIHQKNGGLSAARNAGLDIMAGAYVAFVDSDDYVEPDYISRMLSAAKMHDADMVVCSIRQEDEEGNELPNQVVIATTEAIHDPYDCLRNDLAGIAGIVAWNKLYKAYIWGKLRYPVGKIHEDEFVIHHVLTQCDCVIWMPDRLYHYVDNSASIMAAEYSIKRIDRLDAWIDRIITMQNNDRCRDIINALFENIITDLYYSDSLGWNHTNIHSRLKLVFAHFKQIPVQVIRLLSAKHALYYWGLRICPFLFWRLRMLLKG